MTTPEEHIRDKIIENLDLDDSFDHEWQELINLLAEQHEVSYEIIETMFFNYLKKTIGEN